ncbi:hypothetical protein ACFLTH_08075 [Bacteroidota bacterium]
MGQPQMMDNRDYSKKSVNLNFNHSLDNVFRLCELFEKNGVNKDYYLTLINVDFFIGLEQFISDFKEKMLYAYNISEQNQIVETNLGVVVDTLEDKNIIRHYISCASNAFAVNNSALCIHYSFLSGEESDEKAIVIPGLNYIYSSEGIAKLNSKGIYSQKEIDAFKAVTDNYLEKSA